MMTKEEAIEFIIEEHKKGNREAFCDFCNDEAFSCMECPFHEIRYCTDAVIDGVIDRLLKAEEHQETNFDHYIKSYYVTTYENNVTFKLKEGWEESFENFDTDDFREWLLSPYEPPKPKYKLSKLEYDLLDYCCYKGCDDTFKDWTVLMDMQNKGYFKGIPQDVPIRDILDNCEVTDDDTI